MYANTALKIEENGKVGIVHEHDKYEPIPS